MRKNTAKEKLKAGGTILGIMSNIPSAAVVEVIGYLGYDFLIIDAEHTSMGIETCERMVQAADVAGIPALIRVAQKERQVILRHLDIGSLGVQIPHVNTKADARLVVDSVKYTPVGDRGFAGGIRASGYGLKGTPGEYVKMANEETLVVVQIETVQASKNISEILTVPGIDVFFIGPTDLSTSMGYPGQTTHPEVLELIQKLAKEIRAAGKAAGTVARNIDDLKRCKEWGFQYITQGAMQLLIRGGRANLQEAREIFK
ncbi:MAG: hypothetical protein HYX82_01310 [Chloroflexi bacterium]|nr:hypothetical protein [Chloroflexota bacterium]